MLRVTLANPMTSPSSLRIASRTASAVLADAPAFALEPAFGCGYAESPLREALILILVVKKIRKGRPLISFAVSLETHGTRVPADDVAFEVDCIDGVVDHTVYEQLQPPAVLNFFNSHVSKQRAVWTFPAALTTASLVCSETSSKAMSFRVEPCAGLNPRAGIGKKNALSPAWPHRVEGERAL